MPGRAHNGTSSGWPLTDGPPSGARPFLGELTGLRFLAALLFPVLAPLLSARRARTIVLCAAGAWVLALLVADLRTIPFDTAGRFGIIFRLVQSPATPLFRLPEFLLGLAIGRWYLDRRLRGEPLRARRGLALVVAAAVTIVVIASRSTPDAVDPTLGAYLLPPFAALILGLGERGTRGVLARPTAMLLGEASYAL